MKTQISIINCKLFTLLIMFFSFFLLEPIMAQNVPELMYYKFDGSGTSVPNLASSPVGSSSATIVGGQTQGSSGQFGGALIGNGGTSTSNYVNTGWTTNLGTGNWTISFWTSNIQSSTTLYYIFGDPSAASFRCFTNGVAGASNWMLRGGFTDVPINGGATVASHVMHFVYDATAGNIKGYLDGVLKSTVSQSSVNITSSGTFKVGGYSGSTGLSSGGKMDEFRIYNRALSAAEIALTWDKTLPFNLASNDAGVVSIDSPSVFCPGTKNVVATIKNYGNNAISTVTVNWKFNGVVQTPVAYTSTLDTFGGTGNNTASITLGSKAFTSGNADTIIVWTSNPNSTADTSNDNDTVTTIVQPSFSGTYTIGGSSADYSSFTSAISDLNQYGVCGPVIFNVDSSAGPYNEQIEIQSISGASSTNTITFNGNMAILTGTPTSADRSIIKLNGANYVTFDSLNIKTIGTTYGWGVHLINQADYNTISNCVIDISAVTSTSSSNSVGIVATASTTSVTSYGSNANNCVFTGNTIKGGTSGGPYYGMRLNGVSGTLDCKYNTISNNIIKDFYYYGIYLYYADSNLISGNDISRPNKLTVSSFYAMYLGGAGSKNNVFEKNRIHNSHGSATSLTGASYLIYFTSVDAPIGSENIAKNNLIYDINSNGTIYAIYNVGSNGAHYYHNTISLDHTTATGGITRGFYQTTAASNIDFRNNIITITRGGSGIKHGLYFNTTTSSITSNNNVIYVNSAGSGAQYTGRYSTDFATLTNWQTANSGAYDQNSISVNPTFNSPSTGDFTPTNTAINNIGTGVGVNDDINGVTRSSTNPDPGAYEFTPVGLDAGISWVSPVGQLSSGSHTITVNISNNRTITITSLDLKYTDGTTTVSQAFSSLTIPQGGNQNLSFTTQYNLTGITNIYAYIHAVNNVSDSVQTNDTTLVQTICPALSGNFTINGSQATAGTNFNSFTEAINSMVSCGVTGAVVFNVDSASGPYNEQIELSSISGVSSTNTVTFNGNMAILTGTPTSADRYIIKLNGANYITFDSLNIKTIGTTYGWGVHLINQADYNTISNCVIDISAVTSTSSSNSVGIVATASTTSVTSYGNNANNCVFTGNTIKGGTSGGPYYGMRLNGVSGTLDCKYNTISNNIIKDFYYYGIYLYYADSNLISGNDISRPNKLTVSSFYAMYLGGAGSKNNVFEKNRIHNSHGSATSLTGTSYLIYFTSVDAPTGSENIAKNNLIYDINSNGTIYAIYNSSSNGAHYYHNTISLDHTAATAGTTRGFYQTSTASNIDFRNNIITITRGGSGIKHGLYFNATASDITSNYNDIYVNSEGSGSQYVGRYSSDYATLSNWQTANSGAYDQNSVSVDASYANPGAGNLKPTAAGVDNKGIQIAAVPFDILGIARSITPDPGAYEFIPPVNDAGISSIDQPVAQCPGNHNVVITLKNHGAAVLDSARIHWSINSVAQPIIYYTNSLATGHDTSVTLGTLNMAVSTVYNIKVWTTHPNGNTDENNSNDTSIARIQTALNGNYTIGGSGADYASFTAAVNDLNTRGVCGSVVFNIDSSAGPYIEQIEILSILGASSTNTINFKGNMAVLTYSPTTSNRHIVKLNGAKYVTIDSLRIVGTNTTYGWCVHLMNRADYNTISNCIIDLSAVTSTTSSNNIGIVATASTTSISSYGSNANNCVFTGNTIKGSLTGGPYYAIRLNGASGTLDCKYNTISNNIIKDFYYYGIYLYYADSNLVSGNDISRPDKLTVSSFYAIYLGGAGSKNNVFEKNRIHNSHGSATSLTGTSYLIYFSGVDAPTGSENIVKNNLIYDINSNGTIYGIYNSSSNGAHYYHNTISLDHTSATAGTTRGFYQTSTASNIEFRNNIISITRGGSGIKHGLYYNATGSSITSNYNDIYVNSAGSGSQYIGRYSTDFATLSNWQTANSGTFDQNSLSTSPQYISISTGNYTPGNIALNNTGTPISLVTDDINGVSRSATNPDPGAYEFVVDAGITSVELSVSNACEGHSDTVKARIKNFGTIPISDVLVAYNVNFGAYVYDTFTINLLPNEDSLFEFVTPVTFNTSGTYTITARVMWNDDSTYNDSSNTTILINATPGTPVVSDTTICTGNAVSITVTSSFTTIDWYNDSIGGTSIYTGQTYTTPVLTASDTFYVEDFDGNCTSERAEVIVTVIEMPVADANVNDSICEGSAYILSGSASDYSSVVWSTIGDGIFNDSSLLAATYTPGTNDIINGSVNLFLLANGLTPCGNSSDTMELTIILASTVNANSDDTICAGNSYTLSGSATNYSTTMWTTLGDGIFSNSSSLTATYTPGTTDVNSGSVMLVLSASGNVPCGSSNDTMEISILATPLADANSDDTICTGNTFTLNGNATNYSAFMWSTSGDGAFDSTTLLSATYTPGTNDMNTGSVNLILTVNGNSPCGNVVDSMMLTILPLPTSDAGMDDTVCSVDNYLLSGNASNYSSFTWSSSGDGTFDSIALLGATYTPGAGDISSGMVNLILNVNGNSPCGSLSDTMILTLTPVPTVNAGISDTICANDSYVLSGTASNYSSVAWITAGDGVFDDNTILGATYTPGTNDVSTGIVELILSVSGNSTCVNVYDTMSISFEAAPVADASSDDAICPDDTYTLSGSAVNYNSIVWSTSGDGSFDSDTLLASTYTPGTIDISTGFVNLILKAQGESFCTDAADSMVLTINPFPTVDLGPDTTICADKSIILDAGSTPDSYSWSTGASSQTITLDSNGVGLNSTIVYVEVSKDGCDATDTIAITFEVCEGIDELANNMGVKIYPNPSNGIFSVLISEITNDIQLSVISLSGDVVHKESIKTTTDNFITKVDISGLSKGLYLIKIESIKGVYLDKLIIE